MHLGYLLHSTTSGVNTAVIALLGVIVGGLLSFGGQFFLQWRERKHLARQVALGLAGEIAALVRIAEQREYAKRLREFVKSGLVVKTFIFARRNYFKVFDANADKVGLLGGDLPESVAAFYVQAAAILEDFETVSDPTITWSLAEQQRFFTVTATLIDETMAGGTNTIAALKAFAE
jgi:hypothetical protein